MWLERLNGFTPSVYTLTNCFSVCQTTITPRNTARLQDNLILGAAGQYKVVI